jgi:hypothetical protein
MPPKHLTASRCKVPADRRFYFLQTHVERSAKVWRLAYVLPAYATTRASPSEAIMSRAVRGSFFSEYVRMIRRRKDVDWRQVLPPEDLEYIGSTIHADRWYPMATFERLGVAILSHIEGATMDAVHLWGRFSASDYARAHPDLIADNDPVESLMRLKVLRSTLFNFSAFDLPMLIDGQAHVSISYYMGPKAEEAASFQTQGFCEGVLSLSGATHVESAFIERSWVGDKRTTLLIEWKRT